MYGLRLPRAAAFAAGFLALNLLLFVPLFLLVSNENNFWPFFPLGHPRGQYDWGWSGLGRSTYEYVMQLFVRRHNKDIFRVSADWILIFSSLILASRFAGRWRPTAVPLAWLAFAALLAFMAYSGFIQHLLHRPGTLLDDVLMLDSAWIFVRDAWGLADVLAVVVLLAAVAGFGLLVARYLDAAWRWGAGLHPRAVAVGWILESYGAALWADDDYLVARRELMRRVQSELDELRLPLFTRFATAPVHGGGSWMSTASALSGIRIGSHSMYWAWKRMADRYPHMISYLKRHGYYTLAVQPGATWAEDLYGYDDVIIREDFSYDGLVYGFGHVPDQWALDYAFTSRWSRNPRPRLFHFFAVSTHFPWQPPPRITEDVAELEERQPSFIETRPDYVELALTVPQGWQRDYFVTVAYEWELLLEAFRQRIEPGFIALVFGDHQPPFITNGRGDDDIALHVVTDLPTLPEPLAATGFATGGEIAWEPAASTTFRMEAVYPFVLSLLSAEAGDPLEYSPTGIVMPELPTW